MNVVLHVIYDSYVEYSHLLDGPHMSAEQAPEG